MINMHGTAVIVFNKQCKFSSSVSKNGIAVPYGRSVSIFRMYQTIA